MKTSESATPDRMRELSEPDLVRKFYGQTLAEYQPPNDREELELVLRIYLGKVARNHLYQAGHLNGNPKTADIEHTPPRLVPPTDHLRLDQWFAFIDGYSQTFKSRKHSNGPNQEDLKHLEAETNRRLHNWDLVRSDMSRARLESLVLSGDLARDRLIKSNLRLVLKFAHRSRYGGLDLLSLIQEGSWGLMVGIDKLEFWRGNKLSTYVSWWIRQKMNHALKHHDRTIRVPRDIHDQMRQAERSFTLEFGCRPSDDELAQAAGMEPLEVRRYRELYRPISLDSTPPDNDDLGPLIEKLISPDSDPETALDRKLLLQEITSALDSLHYQHAQILRLRYGLRGYKPLTFDQIAEKFGVSREKIRLRVRNSERMILDRLMKAGFYPLETDELASDIADELE